MGIPHEQAEVQQKHYIPFLLQKDIGTKGKTQKTKPNKKTNKQTKPRKHSWKKPPNESKKRG